MAYRGFAYSESYTGTAGWGFSIDTDAPLLQEEHDTQIGVIGLGSYDPDDLTSGEWD